jgi:site-specific DNA-cytosine methylase
LYWTNIPDVTVPEDKGVMWGDVREHGVNEFYYTEKGMQWLARSSIRRNRLLDVHLDDEKMQMIEASHYKGYSNQRFFGILDVPSDTECVAAMRGRYIKDGVRQDAKQSVSGMTTQYIEFRYDGKSNALTTVGKDNVIVPFTLDGRVPTDEFFFRYVTPRECERLQTVPDDYTSCVSNTQRYRMLGNGFTIDVIAHILKCLTGAKSSI